MSDEKGPIGPIGRINFDGKPDPKVAEALKQASGTIPITSGERLRIEFVVTVSGEIKISLPGPQFEAEVWKFMAYAPEFIKQFYQQKRSPLAI